MNKKIVRREKTVSFSLSVQLLHLSSFLKYFYSSIGVSARAAAFSPFILFNYLLISPFQTYLVVILSCPSSLIHKLL